ncbi:MAG: putative bifunctional diguanylate cyclase/phosphodiesterase [Acidiferrobacter sp.]
MPAPLMSANESQRLAALHRLAILDTSPEERFDRITRLARQLFGVPMALISLIDGDRQWFKSKHGIDVCETPRDVSFCAHAILQDDAMVIPDARLDERFCGNPLVTGEPFIRFYAGKPLLDAEGHRLGTLCILDTCPRQFGETHRQALRDLAAWAESEVSVIQSLRQTYAVLQNQEAHLRAVLDNTAGAIFTLDGRGIIRSMNLAGERMFGYNATETVGHSIAMLIPDVAAGLPRTAEGSLCTGTTESSGRAQSGAPLSLEIAVSEMVLDGERQFIAFAGDISARQHTAELIRRQAYHDSLTGLPNGTFLRERLEQALASSHAAPFVLVVLELDRLTDINNTLGRPVGDLVLQQVGPRLAALLDDDDLAAFLGGGLFALLLLHRNRAQAEQAGRRVVKTLESPFLVGRTTLDAGVRVGIALHPDHGDHPHLLLQRAEVALEVARQSGSHHIIYAAKQDPYSPRRLLVMGELHQAVEHGELLLHYQPKANLVTGRVVGVEALARWQHPELGMIPPAEFIPLAEQSGLINQVTRWVLRTAVTQCASWHAAGIKVPVAVNLSVRNLTDRELLGYVLRTLEHAGLAARWLELEITESMLMADPDGAMAVLTRLQRAGIRLAIDDFGTGYSSLAYLKRLPVSAIKIDRSFVTDMRQDKGDIAIIRSTIELAHNLGLTTIAEGVEDRATWDQLQALGCDEVQGYYLSRALSPERFIDWIDDHPDQAPCVPIPVRAHRTRSRVRRTGNVKKASDPARTRVQPHKAPDAKTTPIRR